MGIQYMMKKISTFLIFTAVILIGMQLSEKNIGTALAAEYELVDAELVPDSIEVGDDNKICEWSMRNDRAVLTVKYDDVREGVKISFKGDLLESVEQVIYSSRDESTAVIDEYGMLTIGGLGETEIRIELHYADEELLGGEQERTKVYDFLLIVEKEIFLKDIIWLPLENVEYAGSAGEFTLKGYYKDGSEELAGEVPLYIEVTGCVCVDGKLVVSNVGIYDEFLIVDHDTDDSHLSLAASNQYNREEAGESYFVLSLDGLRQEDLLIHQKEILSIKKRILHVVPGCREYVLEKDLWKNINIEITEMQHQVELRQDDEEFVHSVGDDIAHDIDTIPLKLVGEAADPMEILRVKNYEGCIAPDLEAVNGRLQNYQLVCEVMDYASLFVCPYDIADIDPVQLLDISGTNYYIEYKDVAKLERIWLKGDLSHTDYAEGNLIIRPAGSNERAYEYDRVILAKDSNDYDASEGAGIAIVLDTGAQEYTYEYYLQMSADPEDTRTTDGKIIVAVDSDAPCVEFGNILDDVRNVRRGIIFDAYRNREGFLPYNISDGNGCGIAKSEYYIWRLRGNEEFSEEDNDEDIVDMIADIESKEWISCDEQGVIAIPDADEQAYIVFIRTRDRVNNEKIYASNGIVVEHIMPQVRIEGLSKEIYKVNDPINCTVRIKDGTYQYRRNRNKSVSGIERAEVIVTVDGELLNQESAVYYANPLTGRLELHPCEETLSGEELEYILELNLQNIAESDHIEITVTVYDHSGNSQTVSQTVKTDYTAPLIEMLMGKDIDGMPKTRYGNEDVVPAVVISDKYLDTSSTEVQLIYDREPDMQLGDMHIISENTLRQITVFDNLDYLKERDGFYRVKAIAKDMAGNRSEMEFLFSVNRFGSWYMLTETTRRLVDSFYINRAPVISLMEYNISSIEPDADSVYYTRDGDTCILDVDLDYVREESREDGYYKYTYSLDTANFDQEGYYDVAIYSKDITGNQMTNKVNQYREDSEAYEADIRFVVDKTSPIILVSGLEQPIYKEETHNISVNVTDNIAIESVDIYCCAQSDDSVQDIGEAVSEYHYGYDQLKDLQGALTLELHESDDYQFIKVTARDMAGNIASTDTYRVLVKKTGIRDLLDGYTRNDGQDRNSASEELNESDVVKTGRSESLLISIIIGSIMTMSVVGMIIVCRLRHNSR